MQIKQHQIWLTLFTLVALLSSGVSGSVALMPMHWSASSQAMQAKSENAHTTSQVMQVTDNNHQSGHCDIDSMPHEHQCCYSGCTAGYTPLISPLYILSQPFHLALIFEHPVHHISAISSALFRPPIPIA